MPKILYVYSNCSPHKYKSLVESSGIMILQQAQKYHQIMIEGLAKNNCEVLAISSLPVNRRLTKKIFFKTELDQFKNIRYRYLPFVNLPIFRNALIFLHSFCFCIKKKDYFFICDVLNISISSGALLANMLNRKKSVGLVTDIPEILIDSITVRNLFTQKINRWILGKFDAYLFLTKRMNTLINKKNRPYVVVEGQVDIDMTTNLENNLIDKYHKKVCIYSGTLKSIYGIQILTQAFVDANVENTELHIYGDGDFAKELREIARNNKNIKYFGVKPNNYIVAEQLKAILLVNPRPSNEEYTKYSFPSKNMEYMVSGTPTLTTKLPGIPKEYFNYVYLIEDESVKGLSRKFIEILSKSKEELHEFGLKARNWILYEKNNVLQSKKLIDMASKMTKKG